MDSLTCVAASSVSWSGLKRIWTFFGHWRTHLHAAEWGERSTVPETREGPTRSPLREPCGLDVSPEALQSPWPLSPSPSPSWPHPRQRLNLQVLNRFRCKRGKGPSAPGGRDGGSARLGVTGTRSGALGSEPCPAPAALTSQVGKLASRSGAVSRGAGLWERLGAAGSLSALAVHTQCAPS
jgi:hypothetical protein